MIEIIVFESRFDADLKTILTATPGDTVAGFLAATGMAERMLREPIIVCRSGVGLAADEYAKTLVADDISLHVLPRWAAVPYIIAAVVSYAVSYFMQPDLDSGGGSERSPTYDVNPLGNGARLGSVKPVFYGRMRTYPDLGALPYAEFNANGDQVLYQLFEVRQGECEINVADMRFEDTPLTSFEGYEVEVIPPGARSTIYPGQVIVSSELSSIDIGPTPNDWGSFKEMKHNVDSPPDASYYACDIGQTITRIAVDIVAQNGIYRSNDQGKIRFRQVGIRIEARRVNDSNEPIGGWFALGRPVLASHAANYRNAVRKTFSYTVTAGRYEVRTVRTTTKTDTHYVSDTLSWVGLRGYASDTLPLVTTTRIALKIRASEQLGNTGAGKFNVISTGKIPTWSPVGGWGSPQVTANPAWVFADILRNQTYGGGRHDAYIDIQGLYGSALGFSAAGIEFHGGFDTETTVWEALRQVAAVGGAVPVDRAGVYYLVRDVQASVPTYMFTHSNIVKDSFRIQYSGVLEETVDAYRVSFLDKEQGYRETSFVCALPGSAQEKIKDIKLFGCVSHDQAFNRAMYLLAAGFYRRQRVELQTGIEGYLPFYGDTIAVSHYLIGREGQQQISGDVTAFDGIDILTLCEDIPELTSPHIILRGLDGALSDAYAVTILDSNRVQITDEFDSGVLVFESGFERPYFMLGEGTDFYARVKIDSIKSAGNNVYTISGFVDVPEVYEAAAGLPLPPVTELPPILDLAPIVLNLRAVLSGTVDSPQVLLRWGSQNSDYFIVQTSADDGVTWASISDRYYDNSFSHAALIGAIKYRVSAVNLLQGQWAEVAVNTGEPSFVAPAPVTDLALIEAFTGTELKFQWASDYTHHKVAFYLGGVEKFAVDVVGEIFSYSLSAATARANGLGRSFTVRVWSVSQYGKLSATSTDLAVSNPLPGALDNLAVTLSLGTVFVTYDLPIYADFDGVSIWVSTENNFTPSNANRLADRLRERAFSFEMPDTLLYVRVAALDVWGDDYFLSGQYTLDPVDLFERLTGEILESHLHQSLLEPIQLIDAPGTGLVSQIINEANSRLALAQQLRGDYAGTDPASVPTGLIAQQRIETNNSINQLASQMALLSAGGATQFDHTDIWYFDSGSESWASSAGTNANTTVPGWIRPDYSSNSYLHSPVISVDGTKYTQVRARIKKIGNPVWEGNLYYAVPEYPVFEYPRVVNISEPIYDDDNIALITFNLNDAPMWIGSTITRILITLSLNSDASNHFEVDWIAIGRPSPGASSAELFTEQQARISADNANASDIALANAAIAGKANQSALDSLSSTVSIQGGLITAQGNKLTVIDSQLNPAAITNNPNFANWAGVFPDGFGAWESTAGFSKHTGSYAYSGGNAARFNVAAVNSGIYQVIANQPDTDYVDVEIVFTLISGGLSGAGVHFAWISSAGAFISENSAKLIDVYPVPAAIYGKKSVAKIRLNKPTIAAGTFGYFQFWVMANYAELGALTAKDIIFDHVSITSADASAKAIFLLSSEVAETQQGLLSQSQQTTFLSSQISESGNNLLDNDSFELGSAGWGIYNNAGVAMTLSLVPGRTGGSAVKITADASSGNTHGIYTTQNINFKAGQWYTVSFYAKKENGAGFDGIFPAFNVAPSAMEYLLNPVLTSDWQRYSIKMVFAADYSEVFLSRSGTSVAGDAVLFDDLMVTTGQITTGYRPKRDYALAGQVDAQSIAFNALTSRVEETEAGIVANANSTLQLAASLPGGGNLIPTDTEFSSGLSGWTLGYNDTGYTATLLRNTFSILRPTNANMIEMRNTSATSGSFSAGIGVPVLAGQRYCFSAYLSAFRARGNLLIQWLNAAGGWFSTDQSAGTINNSASGELTNWFRDSLFVTAPAGAVTARISVFGAASPSYGTDPFVFFSRPSFNEVSAATTTIPAYSPSGAPATVAAVQVTAEAAASKADGAVARWEVKTTVGDLTGGVGFLNDGSVTRFGIHADQFYIFSPGKNAFTLVTEGNDVVMDGAKIKTASIASAKIASLDVSKVTGDTLSFVSGRIGLLTVDQIIHSDASEFLTYQYNNIINLSDTPTTASPSFATLIHTFITPATTRSRKYTGVADIALSTSAAADIYRVTLMSVFATGHTALPQYSVPIPGVFSARVYSPSENYLKCSVIVDNANDSYAPMPLNWSSMEDRIVFIKGAAGVLGIGKAYGGEKTIEVHHVEGSDTYYEHSLFIYFEWFLAMNSPMGTPISIDIYPYASPPFAMNGAISAAVPFTGYIARSQLFMPDLPRNTGGKLVYTGVAICSPSGIRRCSGYKINYQAVR